MKRVLVIALALVSCFAAKAQLPTIRPISVYKVPNISYTTYMGMSPSQVPDDYALFWEFYNNFPPTASNVVASSSLSPQGSNTYGVKNLYDCNHETAWVEGVSGYGVGQWIEYQRVEETEITRIKILNGYVKSDKAWSENARVKRLGVTCNGKPLCILELQNSRSLQSFNVENLLDKYSVKTFRFEILEVYPGTKYQDTVISEIFFNCDY